MGQELVVTSDGSHTIYVPELNENYHSTHGAIQESTHVFIRMGFDHLGAQNEVRILEVGFGTGLNTLLTILAAEETGRKVHYTAIEAFPLQQEVTAKLNYPQLLQKPHSAEWFNAIHASPWGVTRPISSGLTLTKLHTKLQIADLPENFFDLIYFDAFAPQKQAEMWTIEVFAKIFASMRNGASFVTYCAKGQVKRDLRAAGFVVETLSGPPGKREMIRAIRPNS